MPVLSDGTIVAARRPPRAPLAVKAPARIPKTAIVVRGPKGDTGPAGASGTAAFEHTQSTPSASWSIDVPPSMGRTPNVAVYVDGRLVLADVEADSSTVNITFPSPVAGSAVLA